MVLAHGNVLFDILEPSAFQKYRNCWVVRAFFCSTFSYMYFETIPRPELTAVWQRVLTTMCYVQERKKWFYRNIDDLMTS